jgi:hypothetical protein
LAYFGESVSFSFDFFVEFSEEVAVEGLHVCEVVGGDLNS